MVEILVALAEIVLEFVLQVVAELLLDLGLRGVVLTLRRRKTSAAWAAVGYSLLGAAVGAVSLLFFPTSLIHQAWARWLNLLLTPILAGTAMSVLGIFLRWRGKETIRLDRFSYGALFAFCFALVRFLVNH